MYKQHLVCTKNTYSGHLGPGKECPSVIEKFDPVVEGGPDDSIWKSENSSLELVVPKSKSLANWVFRASMRAGRGGSLGICITPSSIWRITGIEGLAAISSWNRHYNEGKFHIRNLPLRGSNQIHPSIDQVLSRRPQHIKVLASLCVLLTNYHIISFIVHSCDKLSSLPTNFMIS